MLLNIRDLKQKLRQFWPRFFRWHQPCSQGVLSYTHPHRVREYGRGGQEPWERGCSDITPVVSSHLYHVTPNFCSPVFNFVNGDILYFVRPNFCNIIVKYWFSAENVFFNLLELQHSGFVYKLHVPTLQVSPHAEMYPDKTADISRCHHWLPCETTSEQRLQKFQADDVTTQIWVLLLIV